jgi:transcriptional regulator with XRE-family HTH domain
MPLDEELLYKRIGERLRARRVELGLGQADIAKAARLSRTSVTNLEQGRQKVPLHILYRICAALDIEVGTIVPHHEEVEAAPTVIADVRSIVDNLPPLSAEWLLELDGEGQGENNEEV